MPRQLRCRSNILRRLIRDWPIFSGMSQESQVTPVTGMIISVFVSAAVTWGVVTAVPVPFKDGESPEAYPPEVVTRIQEQKRLEASVLRKSASPSLDYLINRRRWDAGSKLIVAFNGGDTSLHRAIAQLVTEWSRWGNVTFDFGYDPTKQKYRSWSGEDANYIAHVRIAFDRDGYWSAVGLDSIDQQRFPANQPSMNFDGFAQQWPNLMPPRWKGVVLHEFGHALGFRHEHQQQECHDEIRWQRGPNGEPSVYDVFWQWQGWDENRVNTNLQQLVFGDAVDVLSTHDPASIMHYKMPAAVFVRGEKSSCYLPKENLVLSKLDKEGVARVYPFDNATAALVARVTPPMLEILSAAQADFSQAETSAITTRQDTLARARRPLFYIQIASEAQRADATVIQRLATERGYFAPGIENISGKAGVPAVPEIRFFREEDRSAADGIAEILSQQGWPEVKKVLIKKLEKRARPNLVELWYPTG